MWTWLAQQALAGLPTQLASLDPTLQRALRRFAGKRLGLSLPPTLRRAPELFGRLIGIEPDSGAGAGAGAGADCHLLLEFSPLGSPSLRLATGAVEACDLQLNLSPSCPREQRMTGNTWLGLRLLATLKSYRPDFEEALELWLGPVAAGQAAAFADQLTAAIDDFRQGRKDDAAVAPAAAGAATGTQGRS